MAEAVCDGQLMEQLLSGINLGWLSKALMFKTGAEVDTIRRAPRDKGARWQRGEGAGVLWIDMQMIVIRIMN